MRRSFKLSLIVMAIVGIARTDTGFAQRAVRFGTGTAPVVVPEPKDVFGFQPGDDYKLASQQQLLDYFAERNYRLVGRYLRADPQNLWFAPADATLPGGIDIAHAH